MSSIASISTSAAINSTEFGLISSAFAARQIQVGMRLTF